MTQQDEEQNALHNFNDVEPQSLRDYNRGAVLANIHEQYMVEGNITGHAVKSWLRELTNYLAQIPANEVQAAKEAMRMHLTKRGNLYATP